MHIEQRLRCFRILQQAQKIKPLGLRFLSLPLGLRKFHGSPRYNTDGVYTALTDMRVKIPWIEALRQREAGVGKNSSTTTPSSGPDLKPKKMSDSFHRVVIPLAQDPWLLDNYLNSNGDIRLGTIFMDLDALAGVIAYKHTGESVTTVTAAVDRITINHSLDKICDLEISGQVTFTTGRSSMEVSLQVAKAPGQDGQVMKEDILMTCACTMVSLDPSTKKPVAICPILVETPEEKRLFALGKENYNAKKELAKSTLRKQTPNDQESDLIHAMWLKQLEYDDPQITTHKPQNAAYMDSTKAHATQIMQPQYRNRHNFMIFGGFLLKQTFELAFCCAAAFSGSRPTFLSLDPSTFTNPVPVGSLLHLTAMVAYTDRDLTDLKDEAENPPRGASESLEIPEKAESSKFTHVQIRVDTNVQKIEYAKSKPTGQFNYTFLVEKDVRVMPRSYSEFMIWLDARRRAMKISASLGGEEKAEGTYHTQIITE